MNRDDEEIKSMFKSSEDDSIKTMFSATRRQLPELAQKEYARSIAGMNKVARPEQTTSQSYDQAMNSSDVITDNRAAMNRAIKSANDKAVADAGALLEQNPTREMGEYLLNKVDSENRARAALSEDPFGPEKMEAYSEAFPDATESQLMQYAADTAMSKDLSRIMGEMSIGETALEFGKMLVPGKMAWDLTSMFDDTPIFGAFGSQEKIKRAVQTWNTLPAERKMNMWPHLRDQVIGEMGKMEGANFLKQFLDPSGESSTDYGNVWVGLDVADFSTVAGGLAIGGAKWLARNNRLKRLGELGAKDTVAEANVKAVSDETGKAAEEAGVSRSTAAANAEPMDSVSKIDASAFTGASAETQQRLLRIQKDVRNSLTRIMDDAPVVSGFSESTNDVVKAINQREQQFQELYPNLEMTDIETVKTGDFQFETRGTVFDADTGNRRKLTSRWNMTLNDNGEYQATLKTASKLGNSPKYVLRGNELATEDLNKALHAENVSADIINQFSSQFMRAHKLLKGNPIAKKKKREAVDDILEEGDEWADDLGNEVGHNFTFTELKDRGLEQDQIEYYYAMREFSDTLFEFHNNMTRNRMTLNNTKNIKLRYGDDEVDYYGKVHDSPQAARASLTSANNAGGDRAIDEIYDVSTGQIRKSDSIDWDEVYGNNSRLVNLDDTTAAGSGGSRFSAVIVPNERISELPQYVMKNKPGYLGRSYERGVYANTFVKRGTVNGHPNRIVEQHTVKLYDNQYEQADDVDYLLEKAREEGWDVGPRDSDAEWQLISTDPNEPMSYKSAAEAVGGRMYNSPRASKPIPFGKGVGTKAERVSPVKSIQRQLGHLSVHYPRHQQRMAMADRIQKFADTRQIPFDFRRPVEGTKDDHKFLEEMRQNYLEWASHNTQDEAWAARRMRTMYESMVGKKGVSRDSRRARLAWHLIDASPIQRIRTANFHLLLGMFNPIQLWIQAQGGMIAASVVPVARAHKVAKGMPALATAMNTRDDIRGAQLLAKAFGASEEGGAKLLKAYKNTGFDNSVRANADIRQVEDNMADPLSVIKRLGNHDTVFYAMGERFNRRLSWTTSLEKYMDSNKITKYSDLTDSDFNKIRDNANTFMLSMHAANKARWQKGVMSLPTQFLQVQAKFIEEMLNLDNGLTSADRARIGITQLLMYGSVGIPFFGDEAANTLGKMIGMDEEEVRQSSAMHGGAMQVFFNSMGIESSISSRTAIMSGLEDLYNSIMGDASTAEMLAGPAASTGTRAWASTKEFVATAVALAGQGEYNPLVYGKSAMESVARLSSSYNQIEKFMMLRNSNGFLHDKYGNKVDVVNQKTQFAQLMGLTPNSQEKLWDLKKEIRAKKDLQRKGEEALVNGWSMRMRANTDMGKQQANAYIDWVLNSHFSNPIDRQEAISRLWGKVNSPTTELEDTMSQWYRMKLEETMKEDIDPYLTEGN